MYVIYIQNGKVYKVIATHQEVDFAPNENPQPEELQESIDYRVDYAVVQCKSCHNVFLEYELKDLLCEKCTEERG